MIFVTVGTDHHPFTRLANWVQRARSENVISPAEDLRFQHGYTDPIPEPVKCDKFLSFPEMMRCFENADLVITHGSSTAILVTQAGQMPMVIPRRCALGEHIDDHQVAFIEETKSIYPFFVPADYEQFAYGIVNRAAITQIPPDLASGTQQARQKFSAALKRHLCTHASA